MNLNTRTPDQPMTLIEYGYMTLNNRRSPVHNNGLASRFLAVNYFRETVRPVVLEAGPPFSLEAEIPLAWSGAPRVPFSGDLTDAEDGDWFFRSVNMFGGSAFAPNRVTCFTCHIDGGSDNIKRGRVPPPCGEATKRVPGDLTVTQPASAV